MRALSFALASLFVMSGAAHADEQLAVALERSGYFTGLDRSQTARLRAEIVSQGYPGAMLHHQRVAPANTLAFAGGGVGAWLRTDIAPLLASRGVTFRAAEDRLAPDGSFYAVAIGTDEFPMWQTGEANPQLATTIAAFDMINVLLQSIRAPERLYLTGDGEGAMAWLLTPVQADIIRAVAPPEAWPRMPGQATPPAGAMPALTLPPAVQSNAATPTAAPSTPAPTAAAPNVLPTAAAPGETLPSPTEPLTLPALDGVLPAETPPSSSPLSNVPSTDTEPTALSRNALASQAVPPAQPH